MNFLKRVQFNKKIREEKLYLEQGRHFIEPSFVVFISAR